MGVNSLINGSAPILTTMASFMRHHALKHHSKMVWLSERIVIYLRLPVPYYMEIMCRPDSGLMRYPPLSTSLTDFPPKSCSFRPHSRSWRPMSPYPRPLCSLPKYLGAWLMSIFTRINAPKWTHVLSDVSSWVTPCIRRATDAMIPLPVGSM
jgi:hypothetical protein